VNLHAPMVSMYRWRGALQRDVERQMVIKTTRDRLPALQARLTQLHAYELPEFLVVSADEASEAYGKWIKEELP
jgi:periplasmic divalent cation tolerance protein